MLADSEDSPLPNRILDAAEGVLRRHGAEKTNVVDIAKVLGMSHGNIYRHYPSKKALLEAVASRWLETVSGPLEALTVDQSLPAPARLAAWFHTLRLAKLKKFTGDPELFRMHHFVVKSSPGMVSDHVAALLGQVARIIAEGIESGAFSPRLVPEEAARAFLLASSAFHHPALLMQGPAPSEEDAATVIGLLLAGLKAGPAEI